MDLHSFEFLLTGLRPEAPRERQSRLEQFPQTARVSDVQATVRQALQPVRGPVRFLGLMENKPFAGASGEQNDMKEPEDSPEEDEVARESIEDHRPRDGRRWSGDS